jgi:UDP-N-acetylglucosamine 2-epimerase (non-hydrolysing)
LKIDIIIGTRPNFIKVAVLLKEIEKRNKISFKYDVRLIHTGQHYDDSLSKEILNDLEIRDPDILFTLKSSSINEITSEIILKYNEILNISKPQLCLIFGDVTSTMACAISAKRFNIKVAHVEAGLRSFDNQMPEEINRLITDSISDFCFATTENAVNNLKLNYNGFAKIHLVGNIMIDTLVYFKNKIETSKIVDKLNLKNKKYIILTLHRPSNVDNKNNLKDLLHLISNAASDYKIIFPVHPRTKKILEQIHNLNDNLILIEPLSYIHFINLLSNSIGIITDSGGITEESTYLKVPCITLRKNTERPETCEVGTNVLVGNGEDTILLIESLDNMINKNWKDSHVPKFWDGKTSSRILDVLDICSL